jgi:endonuclease-3 related protein
MIMMITPHSLYEILLNHFGNLNWWPKDTNYHKKAGSDPRFEVIVGAILTQNAAWTNVEKALENLKSNELLDIGKISKIDIKLLQKMVRPTGFFNQKAKRVKYISKYIRDKYSGDLDSFFNRNLNSIRKELIQINGIGPETADSILLYAGNKPIFVVDAYTKRICRRLPFDIDPTYDKIQNYFQKNLSKKFKKNDIAKIYNELHALIVNLGKNYCKSKPRCDICPIQKYCMYKKQLSQ